MPIEFDYGINQMLAVGIATGYTSGKNTFSGCSNCTNTTNKGITDPLLNLKGRLPLGPGTLRFGAILDYSFQHAHTDTSGNSNAASGGTTFTPSVGYEIGAGPGLFGLQLTYDLYKGDSKIDIDHTSGGTTTSTNSGGNTINVTAYYESKLSDSLTLGGALSYASNNGSVTKDSAGNSTSNHDNTDVYGLQVYVPILLAEGVTLYPAALYGMVNYPGSAGVNPTQLYGADVKLRLTF